MASMKWADLVDAVEAKGYGIADDGSDWEDSPRRPKRAPGKKMPQPEKTDPPPDPRTPAGCDVPPWVQDLANK